MKLIPLALMIGISLTGASAAHAQIERGDAPVEITSTSGEYLQKEGKGIYVGDVIATQGDSRITTDKLTVICSRTTAAGAQSQECESIQTLIAEGNVLYTTPDGKIRGDRAEYDYASDTITITGDVISQSSRGNEALVRGTKMVYNVAEGRVTITATGDRVISIYNTKKQPETQPAPAPQPN